MTTIDTMTPTATVPAASREEAPTATIPAPAMAAIDLTTPPVVSLRERAQDVLRNMLSRTHPSFSDCALEIRTKFSFPSNAKTDKERSALITEADTGQSEKVSRRVSNVRFAGDDAYNAIVSIIQRVRLFIAKHTVNANGRIMLPISQICVPGPGKEYVSVSTVEHFRSVMQRESENFVRAVNSFIERYDRDSYAARYNFPVNIYPTKDELRGSFQMNVRLLPVDGKNPFELPLSDVVKSELLVNLESAMEDARRESIVNLLSQMLNPISEFLGKLSAGSRFQTRSFRSFFELANIVKAQNLAGHPEIDDLCERLIGISNLADSAEILRDNPAEMDAAKAKIKSFHDDVKAIVDLF